MKRYLIIGIIIFVAIVFEIALFFLLYRRSKLNRYKENLSQWTKTIKQTNSNNFATLERIKTLAKKMNSYLEKCKSLSIIYEKMHICSKDLSSHMQQLNNYIRQLKLKKSTQKYKIIIQKIETYNDLNTEFKGLSDTLNNQWKIVESVVINSFSLINQLRNFIENDKHKIPNSYNSLKEELNALYSQTIELENQKETKNIQDVAALLNEHDKKLRFFANKVSHLIIIEDLIFNYIPRRLNKLEPNSTASQSLNQEYLKIVDNFNKQSPYQKSVELIRNWLFNYHNHWSYLNNVKQLETYINSHTKNIEKQLHSIKKFIDSILQLNSDKNSEITQLSVVLDKMYTEFDNIKHSINKAIFIEFDSFIESIIKLVANINNIVIKINEETIQQDYQKYYLSVLRYWYINVINNKNYIEQNANNIKNIGALINIYEKIYSNLDNISQVNIDVFVDKLLNLYTTIKTAQIYEFMTKNLIDSIAYKRMENPHIDAVINQALVQLQNREQKQAFKLIKNLINKEKINVF